MVKDDRDREIDALGYARLVWMMIADELMWACPGWIATPVTDGQSMDLETPVATFLLGVIDDTLRVRLIHPVSESPEARIVIPAPRTERVLRERTRDALGALIAQVTRLEGEVLRG